MSLYKLTSIMFVLLVSGSLGATVHSLEPKDDAVFALKLENEALRAEIAELKEKQVNAKEKKAYEKLKKEATVAKDSDKNVYEACCSLLFPKSCEWKFGVGHCNPFEEPIARVYPYGSDPRGLDIKVGSGWRSVGEYLPF